MSAEVKIDPVLRDHPIPWKWVPDLARGENGGDIAGIVDANGGTIATSYWSYTVLNVLWALYLTLTPEQEKTLGAHRNWMKCQGCGVKKDMDELEKYPYPEDDTICDEPVPPLFEVDAEPWDDVETKDWRRVTVCHHCWRKLDADMWISSRCWKSINPVTPFEDLPLLKEEN